MLKQVQHDDWRKEMLSYGHPDMHDAAMIFTTSDRQAGRRHKFTKKTPFPMNFVNLGAEIDR